MNVVLECSVQMHSLQPKYQYDLVECMHVYKHYEAEIIW
jgi:hypothetical protein